MLDSSEYSQQPASYGHQLHPPEGVSLPGSSAARIFFVFADGGNHDSHDVCYVGLFGYFQVAVAQECQFLSVAADDTVEDDAPQTFPCQDNSTPLQVCFSEGTYDDAVAAVHKKGIHTVATYD